MAEIIIRGGRPLNGNIRVNGAKNAVLPIICGALLSGEKTLIKETPALEDVYILIDIIESLGAECRFEDSVLTVRCGEPVSTDITNEKARKMRASVLLMGALLARQKKVRLPLPGGCEIGTRPIDLHLKGFAAMGARITSGTDFVEAEADELTGASVYLDFPSVGATENIMIAATLAKGETVIENAANEPEIVDLANFLNSMGARIKGAGTGIIKIEGVERLNGTVHRVIPDRIEAGTFVLAVAAAGGDVYVENAIAAHLKILLEVLADCGIRIDVDENGIRVVSDGIYGSLDVKTLPYPGFPTDLQSPYMAFAAKAKGSCLINETVFENRFMHVEELKKMGGSISLNGSTALVEGREKLAGAEVRATDLRAGAALIIAGLAAEGETRIKDVYHIYRGYEDVESRLAALGADIRGI